MFQTFYYFCKYKHNNYINMGRKLRLVPFPTSKLLAWAGINKCKINPAFPFPSLAPKSLGLFEIELIKQGSQKALRRQAGELFPPLLTDEGTCLLQSFFRVWRKARRRGGEKFQEGEGPLGLRAH